MRIRQSPLKKDAGLGDLRSFTEGENYLLPCYGAIGTPALGFDTGPDLLRADCHAYCTVTLHRADHHRGCLAIDRHRCRHHR